MTTIFNTTTGEIHELELLDRKTGQDFLSDVIGGCAQSDEWLDVPENVVANYAMDDENVTWWERWAKREQRINDAYAEADEAMRERILTTYNDHDWDMELPQEKVYELLGIEE